MRLNSTFSRSQATTSDFFLVDRSLGDDLPVGRGDEGLAPELDAVFADGFAVGLEDFFDADAVGGADVAAVGDRVAALDQFPAFVLGVAVLGFFRGMPADGGGVEENLGALQRGEAGAFGEPLVPADQDADLAVGGVPGAEAGVAGGEVEFFVVERVIGDVHLAIDAFDRAVGFDDDGGVVVEARRRASRKGRR